MTIKSPGWGKVILVLLLLLGLYLAMRLPNLTKLPIFTDEAIYIRWSQIGARDANWRFISLTDGKQPMFTWIVMVLLRVVRGDPLFVGRLASVIAGGASIIGLAFLSFELFRSSRIAILAPLLYLVSPFALMYDRMALYDSLVAAFYIWNLYFAVRLVREGRADIALILGMTLGAGMLNKTSGFFSLYLLPGTLVLFDVKKKGLAGRLFRWAGLAALAAVLSQVFYSILRLSPFFSMVAEKDNVFIYTFSEWFTHPFTFLQGNLSGLFDWLRGYLTLPLFIATLAGIIVPWKNLREKLVLFIFWFAPFVALALFGKVLYPRFILFMTMPLLVLVAVVTDWLISRLRTNVWKLAAIIVLFSQSLFIDYFIITNPLYARIPDADRGQYIDNWPAGWGVAEVNRYLKDASSKSKIAVFTEGTFGLLPAAIEMYAIDNPNIEAKGFWPIPKTIPSEMADSARARPTFFVMNQTQIIPAGWPLREIFEYQKGNREDRKLRFFQVIPEGTTKPSI